MTLSREDRTAINATRLASKRARTTSVTSRDVLTRNAAVCRTYAFENQNWAEEAIRTLLHCKLDDHKALQLRTYARSALQMARRNAESAKFLGCALHRI